MLGLGLSITFTVDWEVRLKTWGGRFLSRLVSEALEGVGIRIPHNGAKPYTISPILNASGRVVNRLVPGVVYWFRASFLCGLVDCDGVVSAFVRDSYRLGSGEVVRVLRVGVREFRFGGGIANDGGGSNNTSNRSIIEWKVTYYPTVFPFAHHYITYPSPARFLSSAARSLVDLVRGSEVVLDRGGDWLGGVVSNINIKGFVRDVVFNTEVVGFRVRRLRVDLGGGRIMPAFSGVAEYVTYTENVGLFNALLNVAEFFGVGKNRALGFGFVKITHRVVKNTVGEPVRGSTVLGN